MSGIDVDAAMNYAKGYLDGQAQARADRGCPEHGSDVCEPCAYDRGVADGKQALSKDVLCDYAEFGRLLSDDINLRRNAVAMATELLTLRDFIDRYRKTWTGAHGDYDRTATRQGRAECLVCEADRLLGGQTR